MIKIKDKATIKVKSKFFKSLRLIKKLPPAYPFYPSYMRSFIEPRHPG